MGKSVGFAVVFAAGMLCAGCVSQEQRDQVNAVSCGKWGAGPGQPAFAECMAMLRQADAMNDQARSQAMMAAGQAMQAAAASARASQPASMNCTATKLSPEMTNVSCH